MAFKEASRVSFNNYPTNHDESHSDLSEEESYDDTDSSPNRSYDPEWVDDVTEAGELFYIGSSLPVVNHHSTDEPEDVKVSLEHLNNNKEKHSSKRRLRALVKSNKVVKNGDLGPREVPGAEDTNSVQMLQQLTIQEFKGDFTEVVMEVDPRRHNYGRRATACEVLFGIVPGYFENGKTGLKNGSSSNLDVAQDDTRIMVRGFIPDGEAIRFSDKIKIGDWLHYVNDVEVSFSNIHQILNSIHSPTKLKVTFERLPSPPVHDNNAPQNGYKTKLAKLISRTNDTEDKDATSLLSLPHIVMYLTTDRLTEQGTGREDILYLFPNVENKLVQIRGLCITIGHTMADIAHSYPVSSSVVVDEKLCYLAYAYEGNELLIVGIPHENIDLLHLHQLVSEVARLLRLQYRSLHEAFVHPENKPALDHMFTVIFQHLFAKQNSTSNPAMKNNFGDFQDNELAAHWLPLPPDTDVEIQTFLSEFESAEFLDLSDDYYDARRSYAILGSCLFYRSLILANHLQKEDMLDVYTYVKHYGLLTLTYSESISRIIVWKEIFLTRRREQVELDKEYREVTGRCFLLIIGLKQYLFGTILEAGGYAAKAEGNPGPDPCFINQAEALLLQLESLQLSSVCESWIKSNIPVLADVDSFIQSRKTGKEESTFRTRDVSPSTNPQGAKLGAPNLRKSQTELTTILKKKSSSRYLTGSSLALHDNESDTSPSMGTSATSSASEENISLMPHRDRWLQGRTSSSDAESRGSSNNALYKNEKKNRLFPSGSSLDFSTLEKSSQEQENLTVKLTTGLDNILFHYLQLDTADGVFIAPPEVSSSSMLNNELIDNFQNACVLIHNVFQDTLNHMATKKDTSQFVNNAFPFGHVKEHGILFQCSLPARPNQKKPSPTVSYWVVGRLFWSSGPHEVYVCFLDSVPQNTIELAFKLGFGVQF